MAKEKIVMPGQKCMFMLALTFTYVICNEIFDFFQAVQFFIRVLNFLAKKNLLEPKFVFKILIFQNCDAGTYMVVFLENPPYFLIKQTKKYFTLNISNKSKKT